MKYLLIPFLMLAFAGCQSGKQPAREKNSVTVQPLRLTRQEAEKLVKLPLKCIHKEYPNKPGEVLASAKDLKLPRAMHPCFYGCFDWHSAVHGHWSLVKLLKEYPGLKEADTLRRLLKEQISKENIRKEAAYFKPELNHLYERTYGWAWLLKLAAELHTWHAPLARRLEQNLQPLTRVIVDLYKNFTWAPGVVSDRKDGTMVHLDGLNFSRAWCLYGLAEQYPEFSYLVPVANTQMKFSLPNLMGDSYMGGHWLASFAINALTQK